MTVLFCAHYTTRKHDHQCVNKMYFRMRIKFSVHGYIMTACSYLRMTGASDVIFLLCASSFLTTRNVLSHYCKQSALSRNCLFCQSDSKIPCVLEIQIAHKTVVVMAGPLKHADCTSADIKYTSNVALNFAEQNYRNIQEGDCISKPSQAERFPSVVTGVLLLFKK